MAEPFLGEIRAVSFAFAPRGWAFCNGQLLPINQNQALFSLLGTTYGGNGQTTFALPDLRGRVPIHRGSGHVLGERGGEAAHTLTTAEMPEHGHGLNCDPGTGSSTNPAGHVPAAVPTAFGVRLYGSGPLVAMHPGAIASSGNGQSHENMQPFLTLSFIIALQGIFPSWS